MRVISSDKAPRPAAAYSQAVAAGGFIFAAGQVGRDPVTGTLAPDLRSQAEQAFANLEAVLRAGGSSLARTVRITIFLTDLTRFAEVNEVYEKAVGAHRPARTTVGCNALPTGALIEVDAIALAPSTTAETADGDRP
jgi:2-iminobutanoate/2-iminopropanoate deaminase